MSLEQRNYNFVILASVALSHGNLVVTKNRHQDFSLGSLSIKLEISKNRFFIRQVKRRVRSRVELVLPLLMIDDQLGKPDAQDHNKSSFLLPAEAVNIACYVQNRVLVVMPHNKSPCELFHAKTPTLSFIRPFGCPVTILNTIDHLGKFDGKADEGFFVGYSLNSKAFRVFNSRTRIVEENLHIRFSESTSNVVVSGRDWLFDIDALTRTMNYEPIVSCTQSNGFVGTKASDNAGQARKETEPVKDYILLPLWTADPPCSQDPKISHDNGSKCSSDNGKKFDEDPRKENESNDQEKEDNVNSTNNVNIVSSTVNTAGTNEVNVVGENISIELQFDLNMPALEDVSTFDFLSDDEDDGAVADINNLDTTIQIKKEMYVCQPPGFEDPDFPDRVYKVEKALYRLHQAPRAWYETLSTYLLDNGFQRWKIDKTLFIKRHKGFWYLKGQPKLGLWYPKDSPFDLVVYTDSDYAGASLDKKSTTGGCQFLRYRLISWQYKKQTVVANSITEAEYVDASSCCEQVLWIQNPLLDYGHIEIRHHFIRDCNEKKLIQMVKIHTDKNVADLLTKAFDLWSTAKVKTINGEAQLHAKVDGKKIIVTESSVRRDLRLADEEGGEEMFVTRQNKNVVEEVVDVALVSTAATSVTITTKEITLAQALKALKTSKPKVKGIVFQEPAKSTTTTTTISSQQSQNKGKGIMIKEPVKPKKKDQIRLDKEAALRPELVERKGKRARTELEQEITKKQKVEDDNKKAELKQLMETIPEEEEVEIDAIPLAVKEDLEDLYKLVKARYGLTRPVENINYQLWSDMKTMFEPNVEDELWKMQQGYKVLEWKLYDSCGVHSLMMQSMQIYMLVEKKYPLTPPTLLMMLENKLQISYESKMAYQLCKMIKK
nr:hypothetical protein [Tanacetum cinerariifolium]